MALWTDLMDPVEATGIARATQQEIERAKGGTLARFLPNVFVASHYVEFMVGAAGLVDVAHYRAYNSPPKIGSGPGGARKTLTLPAISRNEPINETEQMTWDHLSEDQQRKSIEKAIRRNVQAISDRQELTRGITIETGKAYWEDAVATGGDVDYILNDDFGRNAGLNITATTLWSADATVDRLQDISDWIDVRAAQTTAEAAVILMSRQAWAAFAKGDQFKVTIGGVSRPATRDDILGILDSEGLPRIELYDRSVKVNGVMRKVLDPKKVFILPAATDPEDEDGTELGATFWGRTRSSQFPGWNLEPDEQPGIVCGVFSEDSVGANIEVQGDSIGEPVLRDANATMTITVTA